MILWNSKLKNKNNALTLVELLCVIAVGALLMAIVIPLSQGARRQYLIVESKARFHRYSLALEQFKAEYGYLPYDQSPVEINAPAGSFVQIITGRGLTGQEMEDPAALQKNPKSLSFLQFSPNELTDDGSGKLQDGFGQTHITLYIDTDGDGFLNGIVNSADGSGIRSSLGWRSTGPKATITSWQSTN